MQGVCPKTGTLIQFSDMFARKVLHCAAPVPSHGLSLRGLHCNSFLQRWELVGIRHLLMQEADDFQRPAKPIFFESSTMSSANASTILVVEDDAIVRMLIVDVLEELEFKVLEADGSEQALETLKDVNQHIDLMMTDVGLPVMDGRELANQARALRPALPILFASGYAENIDVPQGMHLIGKPFSIDQLRDKVKSILG
jgi:CheY-like chemotaxis protein